MVCDFLVFISHWTYLLPFSRYWGLTLENGLFPLPSPLFDGLTLSLGGSEGGNPLEFLDKTDGRTGGRYQRAKHMLSPSCVKNETAIEWRVRRIRQHCAHTRALVSFARGQHWSAATPFGHCGVAQAHHFTFLLVSWMNLLNFFGTYKLNNASNEMYLTYSYNFMLTLVLSFA